MVTWVEDILVEESNEVVNVFPVVRSDPLGGWLVADLQEAQVRRYSPSGQLLARFGRRGRGPNELETPTVAIRLPNDEILVADKHTKVVALDSSGTRLLRTLHPDITAIEDLDVLDDSTVLVSGLSADHPGSPRLHVWNIRRNEVVRSFFRPWDGYAHKDVGLLAGWVQADVRGDTIVATYAPVDSLYFFLTDGRHLRTVRIPFRYYRLAVGLPEAARSDRRARLRWMATFDLVASVQWRDSSGFAVSYQSFENGRPVWRVAAFGRDGSLWFDHPDSPRLLSLDSEGRMLFASGDSATPNRWRIVRYDRTH